MPSQNNSGLQYDKQHAVTIVATVAITACRLVGFDGAFATSAGGVHDAQGISETDADVGQAFSAITCYSGLVECSEALAFGDFVKPAADGSGKAAKGTATENCGRALGATGAAGQKVEVQFTKHVHAA